VWWAPIVALLSAIVVAAIAAVLIAGLTSVVSPRFDVQDPPPGVSIAATYIQDLALIGVVFLFSMLGGGRRPRPADLGLRRVPPGPAIAWVLATFATFYVFTFIYSLALGVTEPDDLADKLGATDSAVSLLAVGLLVAVAAPLAEEIFFRGFLFPALGRSIGLIPGALISGAIFGAIHLGGTKAVFVVPLAFLGFLLCLLYWRTGSLLPCMGLHAVNNALALGVTLHWEAWQVLLAVVAAPAIVLAIALRFSQAAPRPAWTAATA
jgi:membrane protease YdiL (CAAX protease family)